MQLEYFMAETKASHASSLAKIKVSDNIDDIVVIFCNEVEAPGKPMMENRKKYAHTIYDTYKSEL